LRPDRRELLDSIIATGERRRHRRRVTVGTLGAALAVVAVAVPLAVVGDGDGPRDAVVAADPDGSTTAPPTTADRPVITGDVEHPVFTGTTDTTLDVPGTAVTEPPPSPTTPSTSPPTTRPPAGCHDSYDPACGPFRWDPEPAANREMTVTVEVDRTTVAAGEPVTITARAADADGPARICALLTDAAVQEPACAFAACAEQERHGPWEPPTPQPGEDSETLVHTYDRPGTYTVSVFAVSYAGPCGLSAYDVFGDDGNATVQVTVTG
jgi:hypothetical protein